jgi:hypothetical protein
MAGKRKTGKRKTGKRKTGKGNNFKRKGGANTQAIHVGIEPTTYITSALKQIFPEEEFDDSRIIHLPDNYKQFIYDIVTQGLDKTPNRERGILKKMRLELASILPLVRKYK